MAFTGFTTGTLYTATQGTSTATTLVIENIRYNSSTGGAGKRARIKDKVSGGEIFNQRVSGSYGLAVASYANGKLAHGIIVTSLPEGFLEIDLY
jgi:hypothetical protein